MADLEVFVSGGASAKYDDRLSFSPKNRGNFLEKVGALATRFMGNPENRDDYLTASGDTGRMSVTFGSAKVNYVVS